MRRCEQHGDHGSSEYNSWIAMKKRCTYEKHPHYLLYGGRGITICDRWIRSYSAFLEDMGRKPTPKHTLERIDSNGNYTPDNCRWATQSEQAHNRRDNVVYAYNGKTMTLREWAREMGTTHGLLGLRIKRGWKMEDVFSVPPQKRNFRYVDLSQLRERA